MYFYLDIPLIWAYQHLSVLMYDLNMMILISNLHKQTSHQACQQEPYTYQLIWVASYNVSLWILIIRVWTLQDQVEYIIHEFQNKLSNHGNIGIISSMLVFFL